MDSLYPMQQYVVDPSCHILSLALYMTASHYNVLHNNPFTSFIPINIYKLSASYCLEIYNNNICGNVPPYMGHMRVCLLPRDILKNFPNFLLSDNNLSCVLPSEIRKMMKLGKLDLKPQ